MRQALFFPPFDALADPVLLAELAGEAEEAGWDGIFLWDHVLYGDRVEAILDPWICLAAMAAATERLLLGPMVTPLARRRPQIVARQALTLDRLSRGRLVLGFGLGDDWVGELSRFGDEADPIRRAALLDEGLEVLVALLSGELVQHSGPHYRAEGVRFSPGPHRAGGIPIWIADWWPHRRPLRRAARYDGAFVIGLEGADDLPRVREELERAGAPEGFDLVVSGGPDDDPARWARLGATWWCCWLGPYDLELEAVRRVVRAGPRATAR